jgi:hypothetical protein
MYFQIAGSNVRIGGTMHWVPKGQPLAHWVHDAITWARVTYLEHDKYESDRGLFAPPGSPPLAQRLPLSWPLIKRKYPFNHSRLDQISKRSPFALTSDVLDLIPLDEGVEQLAMARSRAIQPSGPRLEFLETAAQVNTLLDGVADAVWDEAVCWALEHPGSSKQLLELSYQAWLDGDFEEIDRIASAHSRNRFPPIRDALISARNCLWLPIIRELAYSANEPTLVLLGAAHIGGSEGLLSKLAAGGLKVHALAHR